ncbi:hypothetical protein KOR42_21500 [Thalassoglobus neptunius]|uniref:Uncharacterized protein n=1 Tax=Thalassoglobus neptunius TaxID=1938619 RepID=A0A5C5X787_9PLAN|nr:hypothetical protein KOR42_21500 [Thalassoglobus neptunius]
MECREEKGSGNLHDFGPYKSNPGEASKFSSKSGESQYLPVCGSQILMRSAHDNWACQLLSKILGRR